jgi:hypothetical protein
LVNFFMPIEAYMNIIHYENSLGVIADEDFFVEMGEPIIYVTKYDRLVLENETKRPIKVINPKYITEFSNKFFRSVIV